MVVVMTVMDVILAVHDSGIVMVILLILTWKSGQKLLMCLGLHFPKPLHTLSENLLYL